MWIAYLADGHGPICIFNKNKVFSVHACECSLCIIHLEFDHFIFPFEKSKTLITISSLLCGGSLSTLADEDDLTVMNVVQCSPHFHKTNVLSNSFPCGDAPHRCYCRKKPNQDDSEEVIVV